MSDEVVLEYRGWPSDSVEAEVVTPDCLAGLDRAEIIALPVWLNGARTPLGDVFEVRGGRTARVRVTGDTARVGGLGAAMTTGELVIEGSAGRDLGRGMAGGRLEVYGNVGDGAGVAMSGGRLTIGGNAGNGVGAASPGASRGMTGGEIIVRGSAGAEVAARARRGLVVICGDAGPRAARDIIAGTLVVLGRAGPEVGTGGKRGTVVLFGAADLPLTYPYACTFRPPHLRLTFTYLRGSLGTPLDDHQIAGRFRRYCGDLATLGKGEILQWDG